MTWVASGGLLVAASMVTACSSGRANLATSTGGQVGTGGATSGDGGAAGAVFASGSGGDAGKDGWSATGGTAAAGGTSAAGGMASTGGNSGRGGAAGAGGKPGTGGSVDAAADVRPWIGTPCRSQSDCGSSPIALYCRAPGDPYGCGTCKPGQSTCTGDADCVPDGGGTGVKRICDFAPSTECYCSAIKLCVPGCRTNADCSSGQGCNSQHACQATCVPGDDRCPVDHACGADGFCQQKSCSGDAECSAACVNGKCYNSLGQCQAPAA